MLHIFKLTIYPNLNYQFQFFFSGILVFKLLQANIHFIYKTFSQDEHDVI